MPNNTDAIVDSFLLEVLKNSPDRGGFIDWYRVAGKLEDAIYDLMRHVPDEVKEKYRTA